MIRYSAISKIKYVVKYNDTVFIIIFTYTSTVTLLTILIIINLLVII